MGLSMLATVCKLEHPYRKQNKQAVKTDSDYIPVATLQISYPPCRQVHMRSQTGKDSESRQAAAQSSAVRGWSVWADSLSATSVLCIGHGR